VDRSIKEIKGYLSSILPGLLISMLLLGFAFLLFFTLFLSSEESQFFIQDSRVFELLKFTLFQATLSTIISVIIGTFLAWSISHQSSFYGREILIALFSSSLVLPALVVVFGLISIYGRHGWINSFTNYLFDFSFGSYLYGLFGILLAHVYLNASYASRSLLHSFESISNEKYKLAESLGFGLLKRFIYVEFPAIKGTILTISATIFLLCFTSFAIVLTLGGNPSFNTLEVAIYEAVKLDFDIDFALRLAMIQLGISAIFLFFASNFQTSQSNLKTSYKSTFLKERGVVKYFQIVVIFIFSLFFISPLLATVIDGFGADFKNIFSDKVFIKSLYTSLILATISSLLTLFIALLLSDTRRNFSLNSRLGDRKLSKVLNLFVAFSGNLYLAISSLILGVGVFLLSQKYEASTFVWTTIALLSANVLMSLPFALSILSPAMQKTAKRYDKLAYSLNLGFVQRWLYVEFPYLLPSMGYVLALSFCFSLGDLGIIALFGNDEYSTLPWYLYQLLGSYKTHDAAGVALILLGLTMIAFLFIPKVFGRWYVRDR
jgi:thiamine transport system permease protein